MSTTDHDREELLIGAITSWNEALGNELRRLIEHRRNSYYYIKRTNDDLQRQLDERKGQP